MLGTPHHPALSYPASRGKVNGLHVDSIQTTIDNAVGPLVDDWGRIVGIVGWRLGKTAKTDKAQVLSTRVIMKARVLTYD